MVEASFLPKLRVESGQLFDHQGRLLRRQSIPGSAGDSAMLCHVGKDQCRTPSALALRR
jgi:hypothetical protein